MKMILMARTVLTIYRIHQGPDQHMWLTSDPPSPVARYKVVRFVTVNDGVWEEPAEHEKKNLLPEEYTDIREAMKVSNKLNDEWFLTDPQLERYRPAK